MTGPDFASKNYNIASFGIADAGCVFNNKILHKICLFCNFIV